MFVQSWGYTEDLQIRRCISMHTEIYLLVNRTFSFKLNMPFVQSQHFPERYICHLRC